MKYTHICDYILYVFKKETEDIQRVYLHIYENIRSIWIHIYAFTHLERDRETLQFYLKKHFCEIHYEECRK